MGLIKNVQIPSFVEEKRLEAQGYQRVAGVDEVGRGALAGPVVAAAVILPYHSRAPWLKEVRDSKKLSPASRELLFNYIRQTATAVGIGVVPHKVIDTQGIVEATKLAMKLAINRLSPPAEYLLIDFLSLSEVLLPQKGITNGDNLCLSIACASIIAKVTRDRLMVKFDRVYPGYRLAQHKGYGTEEHLVHLRRLGPCPIHRRSFHPVKDLI